MIIAITGDLGSGKSTVAKLLAQKLNYKHYSSGDMFRAIAKERGITIGELNKQMEGSRQLDNDIDKHVGTLGKKEDNFVIDSRLAWHFIPKSFKVFLTVEPLIGAERIKGHGRTEEKATSSQEMLKETLERRASETKRYKEYYALDIRNFKQYDLVIDTSKIPADQVTQKVLDAIKSTSKTPKAI